MEYIILLWAIAAYGLVFNSKNFIRILICLELMLLSVSLLSIYYSIVLDDIVGQILAFYILGIAGAESAIGLCILMILFRVKGNVSLYPEDSSETWGKGK